MILMTMITTARFVMLVDDASHDGVNDLSNHPAGRKVEVGRGGPFLPSSIANSALLFGRLKSCDEQNPAVFYLNRNTVFVREHKFL